MRITSPKNIPLKNSQSNMFNQQSKISSKNNDNAINADCAFHNHQNNLYGESISSYDLENKESNRTETYMSNKSGRSRSNHHGITMTREKTIKIDNIYEPEHFGVNKNSDNQSTKSITATSNRNTKSISRMTRTTSPTITSYPERRQSQYSMNEKKVSIGKPTKKLTQSYGQDTFDFKELQKQIIQADSYEQTRARDLVTNQDYYSRPNQLTENRSFLTKNKPLPSSNQSNQYSDYNFQNKSLVTNSSKSKGLLSSNAQKKPSIDSEDPQKMDLLDESREKFGSSFFSNCSTSKSQQFILSERYAQTMKPCSPSPNGKLAWRDVIKK